MQGRTDIGVEWRRGVRGVDTYPAQRLHGQWGFVLYHEHAYHHYFHRDMVCAMVQHAGQDGYWGRVETGVRWSIRPLGSACAGSGDMSCTMSMRIITTSIATWYAPWSCVQGKTDIEGGSGEVVDMYPPQRLRREGGFVLHHEHAYQH
jgi:hypothetical protein